MDLGMPLRVRIIAEGAFHHRLSLPVSTHDGGWIVSFQDHPDVIILDAQLDELQRLDLQAQSQDYCSTAVAMSPYGQLFGLSSRAELRIVNRRGTVLHRIPHPAWDSFAGSNCFFDFQDRPWYVQPGEEPGVNDHVTIVEPYSGATLAQRVVENDVGYFDPIGYFWLAPCPDNESALIEVGCGQDGSYLYLARLTSAGLALQQYPFTDRTFFAGFAPNGREFATGAHNGDAIKIHSFPSGRVVASAEREVLFAVDVLHGERPDDVGYFVIFLNSERLLATTGFGRIILLDRRSMRLLGTVWPPGYKVRGYDRSGRETDDPDKILGYEGGLTFLHPAGPGKVLTVCREGITRLLDVSSLISLGTDHQS